MKNRVKGNVIGGILNETAAKGCEKSVRLIVLSLRTAVEYESDFHFAVEMLKEKPTREEDEQELTILLFSSEAN